MREYHAIVSVQADTSVGAMLAFERIAYEAAQCGGKLTQIDSVPPGEGGTPHPRLEDNGDPFYGDPYNGDGSL